MILDAYGVSLGQFIQNELWMDLNFLFLIGKPSFLRYLQTKYPLFDFGMAPLPVDTWTSPSIYT